ncbi:restriction endonuclease [Paenibacillus taichungensis]|uniref:Restriction endonuclease n=1 Tax=Paenibacillus taichungensis TaxID=484184 RepID=A0A329R6L9_9BACL|nr:restriction endonuclease [Paenibacillus taichungensis]
MNKQWKDIIIEVIQELGGEAWLQDIYEKVEEKYPEKLTKGYDKTIRDCIQRFSSDSTKYEARGDIFYSVKGLGRGIWGLNDYQNEENKNLNFTNDDSVFPEGKKKLAQHIRRERNPALINRAKELFKLKEGRVYCQSCGFDFESKYGDIGKDFIEGHHIIPISELKEGSKTRVQDIILLCSNCHSMVHRKRPWLRVDEIKTLMK